jgi:hypothetical protein
MHFFTTSPRSLARDYEADVGCIDEHEWHSLLAQFADANLHQTWGVASEIGRRRSLQTLRLRRGAHLAALAIAGVRTYPVRCATVYMGPLWRRIGQEGLPEDFRQIVRALRNEFVCRLGVNLRLSPYAWSEDDPELAEILQEEGFWRIGGRSVRTKLIMDLTPTDDKLMSGMGPHWRRNLRKAQRNGLTVAGGTGPESFSEFQSLFKGYLHHKGLKDESKLDRFERAQEQLPKGMKMRVLLCRDGANTCAGLVYSCINDTAFFLHSAVSTQGLESRGSYLLQWEAIRQCKAAGAKYYDLDCIDPVGNPGSFRYKNDLAGIHGRSVDSLGRFDAVADSLGYRAILLAERAIARARPRTVDTVPAI